ncbi:MAG: PHP domain-containing protein [Candidatus Omnitrophica bacterium]|nr:PHP domain-containing protein [Candidatus Omnitrophota bacterium]MBU4140804.1 PHP domain-containing protein [Candidatus Omnitrophota bacterium]
MKYADLHIHTKFSDGTFSPERIVKQAHRLGLSCIAITDHDTVCAIEPAMREAEGLDIELIPGVELAAETGDYEIHILGYFIDWRAGWFGRKLEQICDVRRRRALAIIEKLRAFDISLDSDEVMREAAVGSVGRLHIARIMERRGFVHSIQEAFNKYIGNGRPCYVKKFRLTPAEAINMIYRLKGLAVLAHPYTIGNDELIPGFVQLGLRGIEVYYPEHNRSATGHYRDLAEKYGLLITGGSDCHGLGKDRVLMGEVKIPYDLVEALKKEAEALKSGQK